MEDQVTITKEEREPTQAELMQRLIQGSRILERTRTRLRNMGFEPDPANWTDFTAENWTDIHTNYARDPDYIELNPIDQPALLIGAKIPSLKGEKPRKEGIIFHRDSLNPNDVGFFDKIMQGIPSPENTTS